MRSDTEFIDVFSRFQARYRIGKKSEVIERLRSLGHETLTGGDVSKIMNNYNASDPIRNALLRTMETQEISRQKKKGRKRTRAGKVK